MPNLVPYNNKNIGQIGTVLWIALLIFPGKDFFASAESAPRSPFHFLNEDIRNFESLYGTTSVLIAEMETGRLMYFYRPEIAIEQKFPPGSLIKTFSALVLLKYKEHFSFFPQRKISCNGRFYPIGIFAPSKFDLRTLNLPKDDSGKEYVRCSIANGHGEVDLETGLVQSCNVYFLTNAAKDPDFLYSKLQEDWGLGESAKARLEPYLESSGKLESNQSPLRKILTSIGEGGIAISPLKVTQLYSAVWSKGPILSPSWRKEQPIVKVMDNRFASKDLRLIGTLLSNASESGTLKGMQVDGKSGLEIIGAKTGSGTKYAHKFETHGWITLAFRWKGKAYVLTAFVEKGSGGKQAKILVQDLLNKIGRKEISSTERNKIFRRKI
ncbi:penicillin-binding protein, transpeptidase domain protein [Leptospira broomii serovar Hurstbridge str. 5399]|uniref:beta-lactamase n=1 Tax=Leptospira broomii serovar Hurstbridge str. 5399 TaxID=1049789 RepID=T0F9X6_9LEPT|nr:penicillin-binding transpeptidase domain-containing protein [Leptospira broomii]EQA44696.1 penicillin-binding protein, transpeptidase domain protein [Leptospira broomii serovar Hurstbridge str. 5399]